jgi:4-hydroxybenzoate polyprenyltransferase
VLTVVLLVLAGVAASVAWPYYAGVAVCAAILAWEHLHVRPGDVARINAAFGNANMVMSLVFFVGVVAEVAVA